MKFYNTFFHKGEEYRYFYVNPNPTIPETIHTDLCWHIVDMSVEGHKKRSINSEGYEAIINKGGTVSIGALAGDLYIATVEANKIKKRVSVGLMNKINSSAN